MQFSIAKNTTFRFLLAKANSPTMISVVQSTKFGRNLKSLVLISFREFTKTEIFLTGQKRLMKKKNFKIAHLFRFCITNQYPLS